MINFAKKKSYKSHYLILHIIILHTSADKHDIILAVLCLYPVHHYLSELVVNISFDYDWTVVDGEHWVVHGRMASGKCDNVIRKVLCWLKTIKRFAGAL